jgi:hypothetical protein
MQRGVFGPCGLFLFPVVEILIKRSPVLDGKGERRNFDTGPSRYSEKPVPELEKKIWSGYQVWRGVISRRQV